MALRGAQGERPTRGREAPEAKAAQPSRNDEIWKTREGLSEGVKIYGKPSGVVRGGGSAEGASEGRQPLTGPLLPRAAQAAKTMDTKSFRARSVLITFVTLLHSSTSVHRVNSHSLGHNTPHSKIQPRIFAVTTPQIKKKKAPRHVGSLYALTGRECHVEKKLIHCGTAQAAYFHKLLYLAAMPSVRSTSLSTRPSTSS